MSLVAPAFLFALAFQAQAVTFTLVSAGPPTWTYNLTYAPFDNCGLFTTGKITLTGLTGVTGAGAPTSTDFTGGLNTSQLAWSPTFTSTSVTWTNTSCGTGNFGTPMRVMGFTVTAPTASNGLGSFATTGMAIDTGHANSVDVSGSIAGPSATPASVPVMSPMALLMTMIGLGCAGAYEARRRFQDWFGNQSNQA
jgi:hypothetical protein